MLALLAGGLLTVLALQPPNSCNSPELLAGVLACIGAVAYVAKVFAATPGNGHGA